MADDRDDDVRLPKPPPPLTPPDPQVFPPMAPSFAPELPPNFRSRPVGPEDHPPYEDASRRMPHGPPPPSSSGSRSLAFMIAAILVAFFGLLGFLLLLRPASPQTAQGTSVTGTEQTIKLPAGQHLIGTEIGEHGEVYYRYAPLQPGEQPRSSTVEGRWNDGRSTGKIQFIERAAE